MRIDLDYLPKYDYNNNLYSDKLIAEYRTLIKLYQRLQIPSHFIVCKGFGNLCHANYLECLRAAWNNHAAITFSPDYLWYTLLCQFAEIIKDDSEKYRGLFTDSQEKKEIKVMSDSEYELPINSIVSALSNTVNLDVSKIVCEFSTSNSYSMEAFGAAFADAASPYYNYSMFCCGIPYIEVLGTAQDYELILTNWEYLSKHLIGLEYYAGLVSSIVKFIGLTFNLNVDFDAAHWWKSMFKLEHCGSGSQYEVSGWFKDLFYKQPPVKFVENYSSCISSINYKHLQTNRKFVAHHGLLSSDYSVENNLITPRFSKLIYEVV